MSRMKGGVFATLGLVIFSSHAQLSSGADSQPNYVGFALLAVGIVLVVIAALRRPKSSEQQPAEVGPKKAPGAV